VRIGTWKKSSPRGSPSYKLDQESFSSSLFSISIADISEGKGVAKRMLILNPLSIGYISGEAKGKRENK
jgi:hypothetical protein